MKRNIVLLIVLMFTSLLIQAPAQDDKKVLKSKNEQIKLSEDLKLILTEEMIAIQDGMIRIIPALISGNWSKISGISNEIKESFILEKKLTNKQKEELRRALPAGFLKLDRKFHNTAGKLAQAASSHDRELTNFYYYKLLESCSSCHSIYATDRFPELKN